MRIYQVGRASVRVFSSKFGRNRFLAAMATSSATSGAPSISRTHYPTTIPAYTPQPYQPPPNILERTDGTIEFPHIDSLIPPRIHFDEKRVAIGWDDTTSSKLYVTFSSFRPVCVLIIIIIIIKSILSNSAIIFGSEIIADARNVFILLPNNVWRKRSTYVQFISISFRRDSDSPIEH